MVELQRITCKCCGEPLDITKALNGVIKCAICDSVFVVAKKETSPKALSFLHIGESSLDTCKFDEAYTNYKKAAELDPNEPEAYFGMALAEFKVQYLKDVSGEKPRLQPICHEVTDKKFSDNPNYMRAYMKGTAEQRAEYERKAQEIDYILGEFYKLKQSGLDYDCFICVKVTDGDGKTEDSKDADYIYRLLQDKGYKPFYSEYEIRNKQGADYEAHILYALYTSECMLVVCRDESYLQTPWVKNEYTRFLKLVNDEEKESDSITFVYYDKVIERLPGRKGKLQGINFSRREADGQIVDFVESHTPEARQKRAEQASAKSKELEEQTRRLKELEEQLAKLQSPVIGGDISYDELAKKIEEQRLERERKEREEAEAERIAREKAEAERKKREEAERVAREYATSFTIENGVLKKYTGTQSEVKIPNGVTSIGDRAFYDCKGLTSITIPSGVTSIGGYAFFNCVGLTSITIPNSVIAIGDRAFSNCRGLTSIIIPNSVTEIGEGAFQSCKSLTSITIPNSVKSIGKWAFWGCNRLTSIIIPNSVTLIGDCPFWHCSGLKTIYCAHNAKPVGWDKDWNVVEGDLFKKRAKVVWGYKG